MAKHSTPKFLQDIKAQITAAKAASVSQRTARAKKEALKRESTKSTRKSNRKTEQRAQQEASIKVPSYVRLLPYDSKLWSEASSTEAEIPGPEVLAKGGKSRKSTLGDSLTKAKGAVAAYWSAKPSLREHWAMNMTDPSKLRDELFNAIPAGPIKDFERKFYLKWGDYRTLSWNHWCDSLWDMYKPRQFKPDLEVWEMVKEYVTWELLTTRGTEQESLIQNEENIDDLLTVTTDKNSGLPFLTSKWAQDPNMVEFYLDMAGAMIDGEYPHQFVMSRYGVSEQIAKLLTSAILFNRRQPNGGVDGSTNHLRGDGKASVKMRPVECPPKADAIVGKLFIDPMLGRMKEIPTYIGLSGADNIGVFVHDTLSEYPYALEGDFSAFDASCQRDMMRHVFDVISNCFDAKFKPYFDMIVDWYSSMYVITPSGITTGEHGLLSGCAWTSIIGTIANRMSTLYTLFKMGINAVDETEVEHFAFGDDIALFTTTKIDIDQFESFMLECGMDCNRSKQEQSEGDERYATFLGYRHYANIKPVLDEDYIGIFPILRTQIVYLERFTDDVNAVCASMGITPKQFDIMRYCCKLENLRNHPQRMEALEILLKHGMPLEHLVYQGEIPNGLRVGRRSKAVTMSQHWLQSDAALRLAELYPIGVNLDKINDNGIVIPVDSFDLELLNGRKLKFVDSNSSVGKDYKRFVDDQGTMCSVDKLNKVVVYHKDTDITFSDLLA